MKKKKKKKKKKIVLYTILILAIITINIKTYQTKLTNELKRKEEIILSEIKMIEDEIYDLDRQISKLGTLEFIEETARNDYNMIKPRETVYIIKRWEGSMAFSFYWYWYIKYNKKQHMGHIPCNV